MKVAVVACGTRGDVQPGLALGLALKKAGHEVVMAVSPDDAGWAGSLGLEARPVAEGFVGFFRRHPDLQGPVGSTRLLFFLIRQQRLLFEELPAVLAGSEAVVNYFANTAAKSVADRLGIPHFTLATFPQMLPSAGYPPVVLKSQNLPGAINRLAWGVTRKVNDLAFLKGINRYRAGAGLPLVRNYWDHALGRKVILAVDPDLAPIPRDVTHPFRQVGPFPFEHDQALSPELEDFLRRGDPPVYMGFGSMGGRGASTRRILESLAPIGRRLIISLGWSVMDRPRLGADVLFIDGAPHHLLFPRLALAVHHGGSGTTAAAARAGAPQVIVAHLMDQYYWGKRIRELGIGPRFIHRTRLTAANLAAAIREGLETPVYAENASRLGRRMRARDPLGEAVRYIEENV